MVVKARGEKVDLEAEVQAGMEFTEPMSRKVIVMVILEISGKIVGSNVI